MWDFFHDDGWDMSVGLVGTTPRGRVCQRGGDRRGLRCAGAGIRRGGASQRAAGRRDDVRPLVPHVQSSFRESSDASIAE